MPRVDGSPGRWLRRMEGGGARRGRVAALRRQPQAHLDQGPADPGAQAGAGRRNSSALEWSSVDSIVCRRWWMSACMTGFPSGGGELWCAAPSFEGRGKVCRWVRTTAEPSVPPRRRRPGSSPPGRASSGRQFQGELRGEADLEVAHVPAALPLLRPVVPTCPARCSSSRRGRWPSRAGRSRWRRAPPDRRASGSRNSRTSSRRGPTATSARGPCPAPGRPRPVRLREPAQVVAGRPAGLAQPLAELGGGGRAESRRDFSSRSRRGCATARRARASTLWILRSVPSWR